MMEEYTCIEDDMNEMEDISLESFPKEPQDIQLHPMHDIDSNDLNNQIQIHYPPIPILPPKQQQIASNILPLESLESLNENIDIIEKQKNNITIKSLSLHHSIQPIDNISMSHINENDEKVLEKPLDLQIQFRPQVIASDGNQFYSTLMRIVGVNNNTNKILPMTDTELKEDDEEDVYIDSTSDDDHDNIETKMNEDTIAQQLFTAAYTNDINTLKQYIFLGYSIDCMEKDSGDTPLMIACRKGYIEFVTMCFEYGAKNDPHPSFGQTCLHVAVCASQYIIVDLICQIALLSNANEIICNLIDSNGLTVLHCAIPLGDIDMIILLLQNGAKINAQDSYGKNCLHLACLYQQIDILMYLLDFGGDEYIDMIDDDGNTPLHIACMMNNIKLVQLLLETAANVLYKNHKGETSYDIANQMKQFSISALLLEYQYYHASNSSLPQPPKSYASPIASKVLQRPISHFIPSPTMNSNSMTIVPPLPPPLSSSNITKNKYISPTKPNIRLQIHPTECEFDVKSILNRVDHDEEVDMNDRYINIYSSPKYPSAPLEELHDGRIDDISQMKTKVDAYKGGVAIHINTPIKPKFIENDIFEDHCLEKFEYENILWYVYETQDENKFIYYLDVATNHSQWDDPRVFGIIDYT